MSELDTWKDLGSQVDQGGLKLKVHRDDLENAVKLLQAYIDDVAELGTLTNQLSNVSGLGGFQMGIDLARKFSEKGGGEESIRQRLKELIDEAKAMQDVFRKAAIAYAETDAEYAKEYADIMRGK